MDRAFDVEPRAQCPDCRQSLTFVRTKGHEKRWYCYSCEKYVDHLPEMLTIKDSHTRLQELTGLQVVDSHGILVGRVRKAIPSDSGDIKSLLLSVDKDQFKTLLDERDLSREFEISHDKVATVGDVVILSDVFSPNSLAPTKPAEGSVRGAGWCGKCGAQILSGAKHCIKCGTLLDSTVCTSCGASNPIEAKFCKNCGNKIG
jgi:sporulation protein YlmC with PRC-barrel domain/ribosomal protein L40E